MPHPSSVLESLQSNKILRSLLLTAIAAAYNAGWPTLLGANIGTRLLSSDLYTEDLIYDMEISALTTLAVGILSFPYHDHRLLHAMDESINNYPLLTAINFLTIPTFAPLIINGIFRNDKFPECSALMIGGMISQLISLSLFLFILQVCMRNESFIRAFDAIEDYLFPNTSPHIVRHHHPLAPTVNQKSFYRAIAETLTSNSDYIRRTFHKRKLNILQAMLKYPLRMWHSAHGDPYRYYYARSVSNLIHDDAGDVNLNLEHAQSSLEAAQIVRAGLQWHQLLIQDIGRGDEVNELRPAQRELAVFENTFYLNIKAMEHQNRTSLLAIRMICDWLINLPVKRNCHSSTQLNSSLLIEEVRLLSDEKADNLTSAERRRKLAKKRKKEKQRNLNTFFKPAEDIKQNDSAPPSPIKVSAPPSPLLPVVDEGITHVVLNDLEKNIFEIFNSLVDNQNKKYKTFIVGGWAYDKVREAILNIPPCQYNDIDFVTNIPPETLELNFKKIPEVKGLFCSKFDKTKIDAVYEPDLSNLLDDAKKRDFLTFYIDSEGNVFNPDPTGRAFANLRLKILSGAKPSDEMYKEDPLVILRTIYLASKRTLDFTELKPFITMDSHLIVPTLFNSAQEQTRFLHPHRMNLRIEKLFTQHHASENLLLFRELDLFKILFPSIHHAMNACFDFLKEQIDITNYYPFPKVSIIYATFIACAIGQRTHPRILERINDEGVSDIIPVRDEASAIRESSLLFLDIYKDLDEFYNLLHRPLRAWSHYSNRKSMCLVQNEPSQKSYIPGFRL